MFESTVRIYDDYGDREYWWELRPGPDWLSVEFVYVENGKDIDTINVNLEVAKSLFKVLPLMAEANDAQLTLGL